jgi:hypothetical protein
MFDEAVKFFVVLLVLAALASQFVMEGIRGAMSA